MANSIVLAAALFFVCAVVAGLTVSCERSDHWTPRELS